MRPQEMPTQITDLARGRARNAIKPSARSPRSDRTAPPACASCWNAGRARTSRGTVAASWSPAAAASAALVLQADKTPPSAAPAIVMTPLTEPIAALGHDDSSRAVGHSEGVFLDRGTRTETSYRPSAT